MWELCISFLACFDVLSDFVILARAAQMSFLARGAPMHEYVWEHIVNLYDRTLRWLFMKRGRLQVLMVPYICLGFSVRSAKGLIQGRVKISQLLLHRTSSSDWKATATNRMHSSYLKAFRNNCRYCWFHSVVDVLRVFDVFLVHFGIF